MNTREIIRSIYSLTKMLEERYGRPFTLDGHVVGSIGEVAAAERDDLRLATPSEEGFDAVDEEGRKVEIKTTQRESIGLRSCPERLIVQKLHSDGSVEKVYDGPGEPVWVLAGPMQKNGQRSIRLSKLPADTSQK